MEENTLLKIFEYIKKRKNKPIPFDWIVHRFPEKLTPEQCLQVQELILRNMDLNEIPKYVSYCKNLRTLRISNNNIKKIEHLENCTKLELLNISNNQITKIEGLDSCVNLNHLALSKNNITKIENLEVLKDRTANIFLRENDIPVSEIEQFRDNYPTITIRY